MKALAGISALAVGGAAVYLGRYALMRSADVEAVAPSLRHPILYLPKHNKLSLYVQTYNWKKHFPLTRYDGLLDVHEVTTGAEGSAGELVSFLNVPRQRSGRGAVVWFHGGGHLAGSAEADQMYCSRLAFELGVPVLNVEYRLGGEFAFPADIDDGVQALRWLIDHSEHYGIDSQKIALAGASAGAGIAASVVQRAVDEGVPVAYQALIYPMLDDRTGTQQDHEGRARFIWSPESNERAWGIYLGGAAGAAELPEYAAPGRRTDLTGLPATWLGTGTLDLFYPEDVAYVKNLRASEVEVETCIIEGMYHGADGMMPLAEASTKLWRSMIEGLRTAVL
ncbi:alpha/beta hydrolase fold domain-containing protein [Rothia sp. ZJ932]|uniref:alpha/beta hydrolase fold domain-containing protein n=1 Tax=Rothia sp. ZJ932 TaxID=2810516 RepID=UPI001967DBD0|nr:alpha/beta hydrolase fold domain-containing protein [Rothia sp. ZJ932]QRZ61879.1 alpha/beta hydrolase fold domain-containing protein [Rothia sp. ZJ932]